MFRSHTPLWFFPYNFTCTERNLAAAKEQGAGEIHAFKKSHEEERSAFWTVFWKAAPGTCQGAVSSPSLDLTPVSSPRGVLGELERGWDLKGSDRTRPGTVGQCVHSVHH